MKLKIILFAIARDLAEQPEVVVELNNAATVGDLKLELAKTYPQLQPILARSAISVDHQYATDQTGLTESNEVAIIPPVSGG